MMLLLLCLPVTWLASSDRITSSWQTGDVCNDVIYVTQACGGVNWLLENQTSTCTILKLTPGSRC